MNKIYMQTMAYNAEKTIIRCFDSIINQSYKGEICWDILDNGSTDDTLRILNEYAEHNSFLHIYHIDNNCNPMNEKEQFIWDKFLRRNGLNIADDDLFCMLDSDDEYKNDFFEKAIAFLQEYNLDVVAAGNDFISAMTNEHLGVRKINQLLVLTDPNTFSAFFISYYNIMRPVWGKLYKGRTLRGYTRNDKLSYGSDTWFVLYSLEHASKVGILDESLYNYYMHPKSVSFDWDINRIGSDRILDDRARAFLVNKCGKISPDNDRFLYYVYFNAIIDTITVLLGTELLHEIKIKNIKDILTHEKTWALFHNGYISDNELNEKLRIPITKWLFLLKGQRTKDDAHTTATILSVMYDHLSLWLSIKESAKLLITIPELIEALTKKDYDQVLNRLQAWFQRHDNDNPTLTELEVNAYRMSGKPDDVVFFLLVDIRKKRPLSAAKIDIDQQISELLDKYPVLKIINAGLACSLSYTVRWTMKENYRKALDEFIAASLQLDIEKEDEEAYILFGVNLSAAAENADAYVYFKKIWIAYLIDRSRNEEARKELNEFEELLPEDEDFKELRQRNI